MALPVERPVRCAWTCLVLWLFFCTSRIDESALHHGVPGPLMFASQCSFDARWYGSRENKIVRPEARSVDHQRSVLASQKAEVWASRCGRVNARALPKPTSTRLPTMLGTEPIAVSEYALFHGTSACTASVRSCETTCAGCWLATPARWHLWCLLRPCLCAPVAHACFTTRRAARARICERTCSRSYSTSVLVAGLVIAPC